MSQLITSTGARLFPTIHAQIVADSINPDGDRLTSWICRYPRFIHSEIMTHRDASRNTASSRAIPFPKLLADTIAGPAFPMYWGAEKKGMQSGAMLPPEDVRAMKDQWAKILGIVAEETKVLAGMGLHKSLLNRLIEPWANHTALISFTRHSNFFALRAHPDAQPEFQVLAYRMLDIWLRSKPVQRGWNEWHMPFGDKIPVGTDHPTALKIITARAARLSYLNFDGTSSVESDIALHDRLLEADPKHASPAEHLARSEPSHYALFNGKAIRTNLSANGIDQGNFRGWTSYRKLLPRECINENEIDYQAILARKPDWFDLQQGDDGLCLGN